jgi:hypothetical protein
LKNATGLAMLMLDFWPFVPQVEVPAAVVCEVTEP